MNYPAIRVEGAILSPDILEHLEEAPGQRPTDFGLAPGVKVKDEIVRAWADAQDYWRIFQRKLEALKPEAPATSETRNNWIVPLLGLLGHQLEFQPKGAELNGKSYDISHRVVNCAQTPIDIVGYNNPAGLDRKPARAIRRVSAHALVQEYLNLADQLYGLVTNGRVLRLLRDSSRLVKQSYIEFDLDRVFTDGLFSDFAVFYRLLHATRLPLDNDSADKCLLERYHQDSVESGARIRDRLAAAVEQAVLAFGNGFLSHPANRELRQRLAEDRLSPVNFYQTLLRLIYRLLFLMVIEERDLVFPPTATKANRDAYRRFYSLQRLRDLSGKRHLADRRHHDLWLALLSTFRLFEANGPGHKLGLKPLAGDLFHPDAIGDLGKCLLGNDVLLECLSSLNVYERPDNHQRVRVNYGAINVEEFGSIYEGLLEYEPDFHELDGKPAFAFKKGDERAATGSHYTPEELVQPLLKHSIDHLIAARLKEPNPEKALLSLRVADIACGSGHILLAAARRVATELAIVRGGEEQPAPPVYRAALRDVIRTCIFGVDLNPLAVELCKVALWIEAHNPGEPLNFLDHHIKCGNAIVGFVTREEVDQGVPDEAFAKLPSDDPEIAKRVRKHNKNVRGEIAQQRFSFTDERAGDFAAVADQWKSIAAMPDRTPAEFDAKKRAFSAFSVGGSAWTLKQLASIPIAQFFLAKTPENEGKLITDELFRDYWMGRRAPQGPAPAAAFALAQRKRFFHWFLEFPEIVNNGGFDCVLGNPPYLGDKALSGTYGHEFCNYLRYAFAPTGMSDLVVYFVRRIFSLLKPDGFTAFITTNSIKDGDVRKDGLEQVIAQGGEINMAVRGIKWPGRANLVVSLLSIFKGTWKISRSLDGKNVQYISAFLEDSQDRGEPLPICANNSIVSTGTFFLGNGFLLSHDEARSLCQRNDNNSRAISPIINGQEMNNEPLIEPGRMIINFRNWPIEKASQFPELFQIVKDKVKPERDLQRDPTAHDKWWLFMRARIEAYGRIEGQARCFASARTTKHFAVCACPTDWIFSDALNFFTTDRWDFFSVVQSTLHEVWARKYSGALKQDLRYSPSNCFETFAFPPGLWQSPNSSLAEIGERYHGHRKHLMLSLWLGLTDIYNLFHARDMEGELKSRFAKRGRKDPDGLAIPADRRAAVLAFTYDQALAGLLELRRLHGELDTAVRDAYGWQDLALEHGFVEVETLPENDRLRYTISPAARKELLKRLLALNLTQSAAEVAAVPPKPKSPRVASKKRRPSAEFNHQAEFDF